MRSPDSKTLAIVEDDPIMGESLVQSLALEGHEVRWWKSGREALDALGACAAPDAILCDIRLPDMSGEQLFAELAGAPARPPFLFMTAYGDIDQAVQLMRAGAADYISKPFDMDIFLERLAALAPVAPTAEDGAPALGVSPAMRRIETLLQRVAAQPGPVLITGETGVGKDVAARHLHALSRPDAPFIAVNCAAIPAELLESEIFGHEKGAFTGAQARHRGYAERAQDGVLFLDEIAETAPALQVKLLRLIEQRSFVRLGGERETPFTARIVAATNQPIDQAVHSGAFRTDLLYRLNTFALEIPPLRQRPEDIVWLLRRFVAEFAARDGRALRGVGELAVEAALGHDWPGNVRELRNRAERAVALGDGDWVTPGDLFPQAWSQPEATPPAPLAEIREAAERRAIEGALRDAEGHLQNAARMLGVSRTTLWEKMRRLGLFD